jgi:hypothetical protein
MTKIGPQRFLESLLTREAGCSPASPSLNRAPQDGAEQGMAGQGRWVGRAGGLWKGLMAADRVLPSASHGEHPE